MWDLNIRHKYSHSKLVIVNKVMREFYGLVKENLCIYIYIYIYIYILYCIVYVISICN